MPRSKADSRQPTAEGVPRERQMQLDFSGRRELLRKWLVDDTTCKHLLRVLVDHTPRDGCDSFLMQETIAVEMSCSVRTVKRAVRRAKEEGFLLVFGKEGRRRCNTYRLRWAELVDRARVDLGYRSEGDTASRARGQSGPVKGSNRPPQGDKLAPPRRRVVEGGSEPSPSRPPTARPHSADGWGAAEVELIAFGVGDPRPALRAARERGCTPQYVREFVAYARSKCVVCPDTGRTVHAWGPGALRRRILCLVPGQAIDDESLWIPVSDGFGRVLRRRAELDRARDAAAAHAVEADRTAREAAAAEALEAEFGPLLDSLDAEELERVAEAAFGADRSAFAWRALRDQGPGAPLLRPALLRAVEGPSRTGGRGSRVEG